MAARKRLDFIGSAFATSFLPRDEAEREAAFRFVELASVAMQIERIVYLSRQDPDLPADVEITKPAAEPLHCGHMILHNE